MLDLGEGPGSNGTFRIEAGGFQCLEQTVQLLGSYIPYFLRRNEVSSGWEEGIVIAWSFSSPDSLCYLKKGS